VNFFGHAVVARWRRDEPAFVLGAMLPDFAGMCGGRIAAVEDPAVAGGVALHHASDAAFHQLERFRRLCRDAEARLRERGVGRGGARGAAHVAVELLLDGALVADRDAAASYVEAIERAHPDDLGDRIRWRAPATAERFAWLQERLAARGVPVGYRDLEVVTDRIARVLAPRPLLALAAHEVGRLRAELPALEAEVHAAAHELVDGVRQAL
jgi:acyl carrier protein phosphodiesterase